MREVRQSGKAYLPDVAKYRPVIETLCGRTRESTRCGTRPWIRSLDNLLDHAMNDQQLTARNHRKTNLQRRTSMPIHMVDGLVATCTKKGFEPLTSLLHSQGVHMFIRKIQTKRGHNLQWEEALDHPRGFVESMIRGNTGLLRICAYL